MMADLTRESPYQSAACNALVREFGRPAIEFWFRASVTLPRLFGGEDTIESHVRAHAQTLTQARAKARYKVWRSARAAGYRIGFGEVKLTLALAPTGADNWQGVIW